MLYPHYCSHYPQRRMDLPTNLAILSTTYPQVVSMLLFCYSHMGGQPPAYPPVTWVYTEIMIQFFKNELEVFE